MAEAVALGDFLSQDIRVQPAEVGMRLTPPFVGHCIVFLSAGNWPSAAEFAKSGINIPRFQKTAYATFAVIGMALRFLSGFGAPQHTAVSCQLPAWLMFCKVARAAMLSCDPLSHSLNPKVT